MNPSNHLFHQFLKLIPTENYRLKDLEIFLGKRGRTLADEDIFLWLQFLENHGKGVLPSEKTFLPNWMASLKSFKGNTLFLQFNQIRFLFCGAVILFFLSFQATEFVLPLFKNSYHLKNREILNLKCHWKRVILQERAGPWIKDRNWDSKRTGQPTLAELLAAFQQPPGKICPQGGRWSIKNWRIPQFRKSPFGSERIKIFTLPQIDCDLHP